MRQLKSASAPVLPCPNCGGGRVNRRGFFALKDGTRHQRFLCRDCGRTFNQHTGTTLHYLKKRDMWKQWVKSMPRWLSLRRVAATLRIHVATAFRWRHRLLAAQCLEPQLVLTGSVAACEAYVRYSEKGSRRTDGPGARRTPGKKPFRRFIDGKPSCVLVASTGEQHAVGIASRGRPTPEELKSCLARVLGNGAELSAHELAPYVEACRRLGVAHRQRWDGLTPPCRAADRLCMYLYRWLRQFHGVATRYLENYLAWYRAAAH